MVYQFPHESEGDNEKSQPEGDKPGRIPTIVMIVLLVLGAGVLYFRGKAMDVGQLNLKRSFADPLMSAGAKDNNRRSLALAQARVAAHTLYLREGPGIIYVATYLLPENWRVSLIGDYETDAYGEVWARVLVQTDQGLQEGWVSRRYLR
jgi:hypothetical protein